MGGDVAPKEFLMCHLNIKQFLLVDEAHSSGVIGDNYLDFLIIIK